MHLNLQGVGAFSRSVLAGSTGDRESPHSQATAGEVTVVAASRLPPIAGAQWRAFKLVIKRHRRSEAGVAAPTSSGPSCSSSR
jgi:hypothetical protein